MADRSVYINNASLGLADHRGDESEYSVMVYGVGGTSGSVDVIKDIQDGAGDSVMDAANDAIRVSLVAGGAAGGTSMTDDAAFTPAASALTPIGGFCDETSPDSVDEGDAGVVRMSANRNLYVQVRDAAGNERGLNIDASGNIGADIQGDYAEDSPHNTEDVGLFVLAVRNDSGSVMAHDGDYIPFMADPSGNICTASRVLPVVTNATGVGAIATSYAPSLPFWLENVTLHLSSSGSTSENFAITLNANDGAVYDTTLYSIDLSLTGATNLLWTPDSGPLLCEAGDAIDVAWPNSESRTWGLRLVCRLA